MTRLNRSITRQSLRKSIISVNIFLHRLTKRARTLPPPIIRPRCAVIYSTLPTPPTPALYPPLLCRSLRHAPHCLGLQRTKPNLQNPTTQSCRQHLTNRHSRPLMTYRTPLPPSTFTTGSLLRTSHKIPQSQLPRALLPPVPLPLTPRGLQRRHPTIPAAAAPNARAHLVRSARLKDHIIPRHTIRSLTWRRPYLRIRMSSESGISHPPSARPVPLVLPRPANGTTAPTRHVGPRAMNVAAVTLGKMSSDRPIRPHPFPFR